MEAITELKNLAPIVAIALIFGAICYFLIIELRKNRQDYTSFVNENNHQSMEERKENTVAMVKVSQALDNHNKVLEKLIDRL